MRARRRPIGASRGGLTRRLIVASAVLALLIGGAFLVLLFAIGDLREDQKQTDHSQQLLIAANGLERLLLDLETGARGFILTGQERFLGPWSTARAQLPGRAAAAQRLAGSKPETAQRTARIVRDLRSYVTDYSIPLVGAARRGDPSDRGRLPEPVEVGSYFVVSEALTNVAKHARASLVHVDVDAVDGTLRVCVRDDGVGGA